MLIFLQQVQVKAEEFKINPIDSEGIIPSNLVYKIYQDSKGFIWFGTMYGLYRYDGINYFSYRYNPFDSSSIGNDDVISIYEDSKGYLWFGTYLGGVSRYDSKNSTFTRFTNSDNPNSICDNTVWSITEDKSGVLWFGTQNGLSKFENNNFTTYRNINGNTQSNCVFSLSADKENNLWIGTFRGGLLRFNPDRNKFDNYRRSDASPDSINGNVIRGLYCDKLGNLWAGTIQRGICMIKVDDIKKGEYKFNRQMFDSTKNDAPGNVSIYDISEDRNGNIFFSSSNNVFQYNPKELKFTKIVLISNSKTPSENVAMICDFSNCIWVSSYEKGLYKITKKDNNFVNFSESNNGTNIDNVKSFCYDTDRNKIFIGSSSGLFLFDERSKIAEQIELKNKNLSVNAIGKDNDGNIILGTDIGVLNIFRSGEEKFLLKNVNVSKLTFLASNIAAGTMNGLYLINTVTNDTISYRNIAGDKNSLSDNAILSLFKDSENNLWAGTYAGLNKFNKAEGNFTRYSKNLNDTNTINNNYVYSIIQRNESSLYLGTAGGLNILSFRENKVSLIKETLVSGSVINSLLQADNKIWMGTNRGIMRLDMINNSVKSYDENYSMFNPGSIIKMDDGNILAGSRSGFVMFNPNDLKTDTTKPIISFANMKIFGEKKDEIVDLSRLKSIELNSNQNNLEIDFALMDFNNPKKNQYEYKLEGTDENWISAGNKSSVFYSNLNPNNYVLKIRGINSEGIKSNEVKLELIINPPFWRTLWFYILTAVIISGLIFALYKYRLRKNIILALEIEHVKEEERERWREQASIDYHDELGHKLTRISMYSRRVLKKMNGSANEIGNDVNNIIETSNSLRMSARDLIWSLNPSEDSLFDFITRVNLFADELFESSNIVYHKSENPFEWKDVELKMDVKRQMLFILKEGMNNALKYSQAKNVRLDVTNENGKLYMKVVDDGIGFVYPSEYTGYGLLNMQKRAKKAGFDLEIVSAPNKGTRILIYNVVFSNLVNKNI